jgi:hypothetical protein
MNIEKDLLKGDKIKRINCNNGSSEKKVKIYTFSYYNSLLQINVVFVDSYQALVTVTKQTHFGGNFSLNNNTFIASNDIILRSLKYVARDGKNLYVKGDHLKKNSTVIYDESGNIFTIIDGIKQAVREYNEFFVKKEKVNPYRVEYIDAMKQTAVEYLNGTHVYDTLKCTLCKVTSDIAGRDIDSHRRDMKWCATCPWMVLTNELCQRRGDSLKRSAELTEWIKTYEENIE